MSPTGGGNACTSLCASSRLAYGQSKFFTMRAPLRVPSPLMGVSLIRSLTLVHPIVEVFPTQWRQCKHQPRAPSKLAYWQSRPSVMGVSPLGVPTLQRDFPLSEPSEVCRYRDGISSARKYHRKYTKTLHNQPTVLEKEIECSRDV